MMEDKQSKKNPHKYWARKMKKNAQGKYEYTGAKYYYTGSLEDRRKKLLILIVDSLVSLALMAAVGFVSVPGLNKCPYVLIPYGVCLICTIGTSWESICLAWGGEPVNDFELDGINKNYKMITGIAFVAAVASLLGELLYLVLNGPQNMLPGSILFLAASLFTSVGMKLVLRVYGEMHWDLK